MSLKKKIASAITVALSVTTIFGVTMVSGATSTSWNFKDSNFKNLGTISSTKTIDGLGLIASSDKTMEVKAKTVTVGGIEYTYCLGLGGSGSTSSRAVKVPVSGSDTIKVTLASSSSTTSRTLVVANSSGSQVATLAAGTSAATASCSYSGNSGYVYLYSAGSGINIWKIQVDSGSGSGGGSNPTIAPTPGGGSSSGGTGFQGGGSDSGKTKTITSTIVVEAGQTYDGKGITIKASGLGDGSQNEGQKPIFKLEKGATVKNVVIAAPGCDGIHMYGNNTIQNVKWEDVGEDAATVKDGDSYSSNKCYITNCSAYYAYDKLFQCNDGVTLTLTNVYAYDIGKLIRQNGGTSFKCVWYLNGVTVNKVKDSICRTDSSSTLCYYRNLNYSNLQDSMWKFPSSSQVSTY